MKKFLIFAILSVAFLQLNASEASFSYPIALSEYKDPAGADVLQTLKSRILQENFNVFASLIFLFAIIHTFGYKYFADKAENLQKLHKIDVSKRESHGIFVEEGEKAPVSLKASIFHLLGEVEVIFALWLIPLFAGFILCFGVSDLFNYINYLTFNEHKYVEPLFVVVVMFIASTRPVIQFSAKIINIFASMLGGGTSAWWVSILCVGPLLGSFVTEPAAITICASLLVRKFYSLNPSKTFKYATLGLLLTTISAGGTLTHFAAPPVLMVAAPWGWDLPFMLVNFGWKAVLGIFISVLAYFLIFKKEFKALDEKAKNKINISSGDHSVPTWLTIAHLIFLVITVATLHYPIIFVFAFLLFISLIQATKQYQFDANLKTPILVGIFLAGLVTHGSLQAWWIQPVLASLGEFELFSAAVVLTAFNDNAAITYLATLVPDFSEDLKYIVVAGAVAGGGLTVIANAPNPAGVAMLKDHFKEGISPLKILLGALLPTLIIIIMFYFL